MAPKEVIYIEEIIKNMNDKIIKISNELKKFGVDTDYSIEGSKRVYNISSEELKSSLRRIIFDAYLWKDAFGGRKIEGRDFRNDYFSYKEGVNNLPDKFMVISDWEGRLNEIAEDSQKRERETNERMKRQKEQSNLGSDSWGSGSGDGGKHSLHFRKWDSEGIFVEEKIKVLDEPLLFVDDSIKDKDNSSRIMEIDGTKDDKNLKKSRDENDFKTGQEKLKDTGNTKKSEGGGKSAIPFIFIGLVGFLGLVGFVAAFVAAKKG